MSKNTRKRLKALINKPALVAWNCNIYFCRCSSTDYELCKYLSIACILGAVFANVSHFTQLTCRTAKDIKEEVLDSRRLNSCCQRK